MYRPLTGDMLETCLDEAAQKLIGHTKGGRLDREHIATYAWPQQWPDSSCGFPGGLSLQAFWVAPTIVAVGPSDDVCVFHNGQFVVHLNKPGDDFEARVRVMNLPGANSKAWWESQEMEPNAVMDSDSGD